MFLPPLANLFRFKFETKHDPDFNMFKLTLKYFPSHNSLTYLYITVFSSQIQLVQLLVGVGLGGGSRLATELMRATLTGQGHRDHAKGMDNSQLFTVYSLPPNLDISQHILQSNSRGRVVLS